MQGCNPGWRWAGREVARLCEGWTKDELAWPRRVRPRGMASPRGDRAHAFSPGTQNTSRVGNWPWPSSNVCLQGYRCILGLIIIGAHQTATQSHQSKPFKCLGLLYARRLKMMQLQQCCSRFCTLRMGKL